MPSTEEQLQTEVLNKLRNDPLSITEHDARRLSEQLEVTDPRSANIISAVECLAQANPELKQHPSSPIGHQDPQLTQLALVNDLKAAVTTHPKSVTAEILKVTQAIVSQMQRALGQSNAPHPELEAELQAEIAKIEPKIEQGTVTREEADKLHSLEARAHGHTEKGGITATAQSVAARRERALSLSDNTNASHSPTRTGSSVANSKQASTAATSTGASHSHSIRVSADHTTAKLAGLSLAENEPKDGSKDGARGHTRKGSSATAVEAH